jgi:hypothetical protein
MIAESALLRAMSAAMKPAAAFDAGAALGAKLIARLEANALMRFTLEN